MSIEISLLKRRMTEEHKEAVGHEGEGIRMGDRRNIRSPFVQVSQDWHKSRRPFYHQRVKP